MQKLDRRSNSETPNSAESTGIVPKVSIQSRAGKSIHFLALNLFFRNDSGRLKVNPASSRCRKVWINMLYIGWFYFSRSDQNSAIWTTRMWTIDHMDQSITKLLQFMRKSRKSRTKKWLKIIHMMIYCNKSKTIQIHNTMIQK